MRKLTEEQVLSIPTLVNDEEKTLVEVAEILGVSTRQVSNHVKTLRAKGYKINTIMGGRPILK